MKDKGLCLIDPVYSIAGPDVAWIAMGGHEEPGRNRYPCDA
jgi:hypothetical protein